MALRRRVVAARGRTRRLTTWFEFPPATTTIGGSTASLIGVLNAAALAMRPFTVIRSHIAFAVKSDQAAAIEQQNVGFGMAVVSDQSIAIGVTAVPTPITDLASSLWFLHSLNFAEESALTDRTKPHSVRYLDSKAMRKVEIGQDIAIVIETAAVGQGAIVTAGGRFLVKNN